MYDFKLIDLRCQMFLSPYATFQHPLFRFNYEPPTELRECNVFGCVCLSTGGSLHNTTHDALTSLYSPLVPAPHPWPLDMGPPPALAPTPC